MNLEILRVGKKLAPAESAWVENYVKRIRPYGKFSITRISEAPGQNNDDRAQKTWAAIQKKISKQAFTILLDSKGALQTTEQLSELFTQAQKSGRNRLQFIVGGSYGLPSTARSYCDVAISLTPLTLPHRIALLVLVEQIYRVLSWQAGSPYHHS